MKEDRAEGHVVFSGASVKCPAQADGEPQRADSSGQVIVVMVTPLRPGTKSHWRVHGGGQIPSRAWAAAGRACASHVRVRGPRAQRPGTVQMGLVLLSFLRPRGSLRRCGCRSHFTDEKTEVWGDDPRRVQNTRLSLLLHRALGRLFFFFSP